MDIKPKINISEQFSVNYLFFIICTATLGIELASVPTIVFLNAGHDAWISIMIAYAIVVIIVLAMLAILRRYENTDILGIQADLFGSFISKVIGTIYIIFFAIYALTILLLYTEMIRVFIFPEMPRFVLGFFIMSLVIYSILGGMKVIIGIHFHFFVTGYVLLLFLLGRPMMDVDFLQFLPVLDASTNEILQGAFSMRYTLMGFEILFFIYPFIENKKKITRVSLAGFSLSALIILVVTSITIGYFSAAQLERRIWAVMSLFKLQNFTFIERLDYFVITEFMMVMLPNMIITSWALIYTVKRMYKVSEKTTSYIYSVILIIFATAITDFYTIEAVITIVEKIGFWLVYIYPLILLPIVLIKKRKNTKGRRAPS